MRGAEVTKAARPGRTSNSTWSEGSKNYIRNVEAVGSNPITSTDKSGSEGQSGTLPEGHVLFRFDLSSPYR